MLARRTRWTPRTERVDIKVQLGHERVATTRIDTDVGQERMEQVVGRL